MSDPVGWIAPKTDWVPNDGIANTDLNRIEGNIDAINNWIKQTGNFGIVGSGMKAADEPTGTVYWEKHAQGIVVMYWPTLLGWDGGAFKIAPATTWPAAIRVQVSGIYVNVTLIDSYYSYSIGAVELPHDANTAIFLLQLRSPTGGNVFTSGTSGLVKSMTAHYTTEGNFGV